MFKISNCITKDTNDIDKIQVYLLNNFVFYLDVALKIFNWNSANGNGTKTLCLDSDFNM